MAADRVSLRDPRRPPPHPGEILRQLYVDDGDYTQVELAEAFGVSRQRLHLILSGMSAISANMALRIGHVLGNGPEFWLRLQNAHDLWRAEQIFDVTKLPKLPRQGSDPWK